VVINQALGGLKHSKEKNMKKLKIKTESFILGMAYSVVPFTGVMVLVLLINASQKAGVVEWVNAIWAIASVTVLLYFSWRFWEYLNKKLKVLREELKVLNSKVTQ
jgi:hypothetical protein